MCALSSNGTLNITVHVNTTAKNGTAIGNDIASALADHIQHWAHAQKGLRGGATGKLPGAVGSSR
jgi:hypothetical protein